MSSVREVLLGVVVVDDKDPRVVPRFEKTIHFGTNSVTRQSCISSNFGLVSDDSQGYRSDVMRDHFHVISACVDSTQEMGGPV